MTRILSQQLKETITAQSTDRAFIALVEMRHTSWPTPVRYAGDTVDYIHGGNTYNSFPFFLMLPDDEDEGFPVLKWTADNVTNEIATAFRSVAGATGKVYATVFWVLDNDPDTVQAGPFEVEISGVTYDEKTISGTMTIEPVLDDQFGYMEMTPKNAPGLF